MRRARRTWLAGALVLAGCEPGDRDGGRTASSSDSSPAPIAATRPADTADSNWKIAPNRFGLVSPETSEADVRRNLGDSLVARIRVELGEGETSPGTVLFQGDSTRRAEIIWRDTLRHRNPHRVVLRGISTRWQTGRGISLGTTLQDLERLNGGPFTLAGFGWDYAGVITEWNGGALDGALTGIRLYLEPGAAQRQSAAYAQVLGDRDYSSALPAMQQLNPKVTQIFVDFDHP